MDDPSVRVAVNSSKQSTSFSSSDGSKDDADLSWELTLGDFDLGIAHGTRSYDPKVSTLQFARIVSA